ncbi:DUF3221 domain-containing protein [Lentibacillus sediminis]|uniref:DUF3221 domain-containing protein n=1 Tax=Lentibacillus sediminis TaxID=1940529 RepID=UPI000C1C7636|nr:DUF3221 domain-containing protein [Lentibacillus sediminis]
MLKNCFLLLVFSILLIGCSTANEEENSDFNGSPIDIEEVDFTVENSREGYVLFKQEDGFDFAPTWDEELRKEVEESKDLRRYPDAMYVSISRTDFDMSELEEGDRVRIWVFEVLEMAPPLGYAEKVEIIEGDG